MLAPLEEAIFTSKEDLLEHGGGRDGPKNRWRRVDASAKLRYCHVTLALICQANALLAVNDNPELTPKIRTFDSTY